MAVQTWTLSSGDDRAEISAFGAIANSWVVSRGGQDCELLDGYHTETERDELHGYRNAVLAPWSNRIREAKFSFDGREVDLGPDAAGVREALHGLISGCEFLELDSGEDWVQLATQIRRDGAYPYAVQVAVLYRLFGTDGVHRLEMTMTAVNTGQEDAPVTLGWHPYLRHLGPSALARVRLPAATAIRTDAANIPLPGGAAFVSVADAVAGAGGIFTPAQRASDVAGDLVIQAPADLDHAFTDLRVDADTWARAELTHGDGSRVCVEFLPETLARGVGIFQVFTGEVLPERGGEAIAIEPCLAMTDAFNRDECADFVRLAPGEVQTLRAALSFSDDAR